MTTPANFSARAAKAVVDAIAGISVAAGYRINWATVERWNGDVRDTTRLPFAEVSIASIQTSRVGVALNVDRVTVWVDAIVSRADAFEFGSLDELVDVACADVRRALYSMTAAESEDAEECDLVSLSFDPYHGSESNPSEVGFRATATLEAETTRSSGVKA